MDEISNVRRGLLTAQFEGLASIADTVRGVLEDLTERETVSTSSSRGQALRDIPGTITDVGAGVPDELARIPRIIANRFLDEYPPRSARAGGSRRVARVRRTPDDEVVSIARAYLARIPGGGATVSGVVDHVALQLDRDPSVVQPVILRHFPNNGVVLRRSVISPTADDDPAVTRMRQTLIEWGYVDIREDVELEVFPDLEDEAVLVAYSGDQPVILCYPVSQGWVFDSSSLESARFQAATINTEHVAQYIWVSDGVDDFYFDVEADVAVSSLPQLSAAARPSRRRGSTGAKGTQTTGPAPSDSEGA